MNIECFECFDGFLVFHGSFHPESNILYYFRVFILFHITYLKDVNIVMETINVGLLSIIWKVMFQEMLNLDACCIIQYMLNCLQNLFINIFQFLSKVITCLSSI